MTGRTPWRWASVAGIGVLVALCAVPVAALVPSAVSHPDVAAGALSARRLGLLVNSVRLASLVLVVDAVVAGLAVLWAHASGPRRSAVVMGIALPAAFVPPVAHAAAWSGLSAAVRSVLSLPVTPLTGLPAAVLAQSSAYLPFVTAIALAAVSAIDPGSIDAARVQRPDGAVMARVILPLATPGILAGAGVAALLSLGDEAVPAAFGVDTAAMELFASYAADGRPGVTLALAWPLAAVCLLSALACAAPLRAISLRSSWGRSAWSVRPSLGPVARVSLRVGMLASVAVPAAVYISLVAGAMPPAAAFAALRAAAPDIGTTCAVALVAGAVAGVVGLLAGTPAGPATAPSRWVWVLVLMAAVVPAPVMGAGLAALYDRPATGWLYDSSIMLALAAGARFAPIAAIVVAVAAARLDAGALEAALVGARPGRALVRVVVPRLAMPAAAGGLAVAAFSAGELGATLMVVPPGMSTAVVRAFNLLHYGASRDVAAIAVAVGAIGVTCAGCAWMTARRMWDR